MNSFLGLDIGTSGVRATLISDTGQIMASSSAALPVSFKQQEMLSQQPEDWWHAVLDCLQQLSSQHDLAGLQAISIDGTSGTTLLTDAQNRPVSPALMYNDLRPAELVEELCNKAPPVPACSRTGALSRAVWLFRNYTPAGKYFIQQQADWVLSQLTGVPGISDWNNALKLGFDPETLTWPDWLEEINLSKGRDGFREFFLPVSLWQTFHPAWPANLAFLKPPDYMQAPRTASQPFSPAVQQSPVKLSPPWVLRWHLNFVRIGPSTQMPMGFTAIVWINSDGWQGVHRIQAVPY